MQLVQNCTELYCNRKYSLLSQIGHLGVADRRPHKAGHQGDHQRLSQNVTYYQRLSHVVTDHQKLSQNFKDLFCFLIIYSLNYSKICLDNWFSQPLCLTIIVIYKRFSAIEVISAHFFAC